MISHRYKETCKNSFEPKANHTSTSVKNKQPTVNSSDTDSEGGTYTIDKDNEQVKEARKSIDQVFGISSEDQNDENISVSLYIFLITYDHLISVNLPANFRVKKK